MPATVTNMTAPTAGDSLQRDPSRYHDVDHLVADQSLSRQQKIKTLMRWQHEARKIEMRGGQSSQAQLTLILQALHTLEANDFV